MIDFILTGLSFVLVGLQLRSSAAALLNRPTQVMVTTIAVCLTVIVIRPIWVFATVLVSRSLAAFLGETATVSSERARHSRDRRRENATRSTA